MPGEKEMMEHTKGVWKIRQEGTNSGQWLEIYVEGEHYNDGSEFVIAECGTVKSKPHGKNWVRANEAGVVEANARLIAAAPDLLEALKDQLQLMVGYKSRLECDGAHVAARQVDDRIEMVKAVISAATRTS